VDPLQLRFVDEVHFEPKSLKRHRGYAPRGSRIIRVGDEFLRERYSMVLLTVPGGTPRPFAARLYNDTIDANKFVLFIFCCILSGHLREGNWLISDNASLHFSTETYEILMAMLTAAGVKVRFLPTYSPEFNPCEFLFGLKRISSVTTAVWASRCWKKLVLHLP
jgi:hypothetical protein